MLKLCIDARMLHASGIGTFLKTLLPHLEHHFELILLHDAAASIDVRADCIPMESKIYTLKEQWELFRKIPKCDLFWSPHYNIPLLPIRARKRLVTLHDVYPLVFFDELSPLKKIYARLFFWAALKYADCVTTVSEFTRTEISRYCRNRREVIPIHNGVDNRFTPQKTGGGDYLLAVGNIKRHKNLLRLVQAFEQIDCSERLLLIGRKEGLRSRDEALLDYVDAHLKERVHFTGYLSDEAMVRLYSEAKLFLFPSYYEGFGFPPLEAMACDCPVVAARAASIPEVCGEAAYYVDPYDVASIRKGIETVLKNASLRLDLIEKGRERVLKFTSEKCANRYIDLIHERTG